MKLPTDRKERTKVLVLVALGVMALLSVTLQGLYSLTAKKKRMNQELDDLVYQTQTAAVHIQQAAGLRTRNAEAVGRVLEISDRHILHPILGNYRLGASEFLERHAADCGVELGTLQEVGIMELPRAAEAKDKGAIKAYTARATIECDYFTLLDFPHRVESANPFVCIATLQIASQGEKIPEKHRVTVGIQWPIWADETMVETIRSRGAAAGLSRGGS